MNRVTLIAVGDTQAAVVEELALQHGRLNIVRRCPELAELLAACQSGLAQVAFVARFSEDLTATLVDRLTAVGVGVVAVADSPEEARRLRGIGATPVAEHVAAASLVAVVCAAVEDRRHPGQTGYAVPSAEASFHSSTAMPADDAGAWPSSHNSAAVPEPHTDSGLGPGNDFTDGSSQRGPDTPGRSKRERGETPTTPEDSPPHPDDAQHDDARGTASDGPAGQPEGSLNLGGQEKADEDGSSQQSSRRAGRLASWGGKIAVSLGKGKDRKSARGAGHAGTFRKQESNSTARFADPAIVATSAVGASGAVPGRIVAVWGPIGSPGRTTVAINLAAEQAAAGRKVMLIDADCYGASVAASLGLLDESASFAQACRAADQGALSPAALARITTELVFAGGTFSLLTGLTRADRWPELRAAAVERVLQLARGMAEVVVVDCGFSLESDEELSYDTVAPRRNAATLAVLSQAQLIYAIGNSDPVGIPRLIKGLGELVEACPGAEVRVVVNKVRRKAVGGSPEKALAQAWDRFGPGLGISHFLPWDPELTDKALLEGRLLLEIAPDTPLRRAIRDINCAADQQKSKVAVVKPTAKLEVHG